MGFFNNNYAGILEWERIDNQGDGSPQYLSRAKVYGGWLVSIIQNASMGGNGLTFVPDPEHQWIFPNKDFDSKKSEYLQDYKKRKE